MSSINDKIPPEDKESCSFRKLSVEEALQWQRNLPGKTLLFSMAGSSVATILHFPDGDVAGHIAESKDIAISPSSSFLLSTNEEANTQKSVLIGVEEIADADLQTLRDGF
jgi:hypothetical protein